MVCNSERYPRGTCRYQSPVIACIEGIDRCCEMCQYAVQVTIREREDLHVVVIAPHVQFSALNT